MCCLSAVLVNFMFLGYLLACCYCGKTAFVVLATARILSTTKHNR